MDEAYKAFLKEAFNYGLVGGFMFVVCYLLVRYTPKLVSAVITYIEKQSIESAKLTRSVQVIAESGETLTELNERQAKVMESQAATQATAAATLVKVTNGVEKNGQHIVRMNSALMHLAQAMREIANVHPVAEKAGPYIQRAINALKNYREPDDDSASP